MGNNRCAKTHEDYTVNPLCEKCDTNFANWFGWCVRCPDNSDKVDPRLLIGAIFFTCEHVSALSALLLHASTSHVRLLNQMHAHDQTWRCFSTAPAQVLHRRLLDGQRWV